MVVTRFAPSPTGYLHVGGARTALFNWLMAKKTGGKFLLRIEDTDQKRNTASAAAQVMADLRWLGIQWDEGPEVGGPNGPYYQSERLDIYKTYLDKLIESGKAYYCFETSEELTEIREESIKEKRNLIYPRPEFFPDKKDVEKARAEGRPVTIRFAIPQDKPIIVNDIIRGEITFQPKELSDFIIQKSDGFPTYHFACVVDDELMNVTHIIRGQEHLMNTPCHIPLQQALGFRTPQYAHMSVTVSESGGKLSKRERPKALQQAIKQMADVNLEELAKVGNITVEELDSFINGKSIPDMPNIDAIAEHVGIRLPEINVVDFFRSGYLPETMVNFLALLGWNPGNNREVMTTEELIECFDLTRATKTNSLFDRKKLLSFNTEHIKMQGPEKMLPAFKAFLKEINSPVAKADDEMLKKLIHINVGARTLEDIDKKCRFFFVKNDEIEYDPQAVKKVLLKDRAIEILAIVRQRLAEMSDFTEEGIEAMLRGLAEEEQVGLGKVAQPLRVSMCGTTVSPPVFDSVQILGIENTLKRIDIALEKFKI